MLYALSSYINIFFLFQSLEKGNKWDFWKLKTSGEAKPVQSTPVIMLG